MGLPSSTSSSTHTSIRRHHINNRTATMKNSPVHPITHSHRRTHKARCSNHTYKPKSNTAISTITATPSITFLLSTCHSLDLSICSPTTSQSEINTWQTLDPWTYLTSPILIAKWKSSLQSLCQQYLDGIFTPCVFEEKLIALLPRVQKLEEARRRVNEELEGELRDRGVWVQVPEAFWQAVEERVSVIDGVFEEVGKTLDGQ